MRWHSPFNNSERSTSQSRFLDSLTRAEGECYLGHLKKINDSKDWKSSAWFLARKYPEDWAEVKKHAETNPDGQELSPAKRKQAVDAILKERFGDTIATA